MIIPVTAAMIALMVSAAADARIQTYQVVRLLSYRSECRLTKLEDRSTAKGPMIFFALCENVSFYPDGIEIVCDDRDDDRSCKIATKEKSFDQLDLLKPPAR